MVQASFLSFRARMELFMARILTPIRRVETNKRSLAMRGPIK